jgi:hypothetical protein
VDLPAQDRDLMAQHEAFDVFRAAVAGELGEHLQNLTQEQVYQRTGHYLDCRRYRRADSTQNRTSQPRTEFTSPTGSLLRLPNSPGRSDVGTTMSSTRPSIA